MILCRVAQLESYPEEYNQLKYNTAIPKNSLRPSSLGWRMTNFAATPDKSRDKFAQAYFPPTLRNRTESKILPLSQNKLVI